MTPTALDRLCATLSALRPGAKHRIATYEAREIAERDQTNLSTALRHRAALGHFAPDFSFRLELCPVFRGGRGGTCTGELGPFFLLAERIDTRKEPEITFTNWKAAQRGGS